MRGLLSAHAFSALLAMSIAALAEPAIDPAHALAEKFANDGVVPVKPAAARPAEAKAVEAKPAPAKSADAKPARPSLDYEMEMLRRARAEEAERAKGSATAAPTAQSPDPAPQPSPPQAAKVEAPAPVATPPPVQPAPVAEPPAPPAAASAPAIEAKADPKTAPAEYRILDDGSPRATVLLILETAPGGKTAVQPDPIMCVGTECYASLGFDTGATMVPRTEADKLKSSDDVKAGTCKDKTGCVFRDVPIASGAKIEIIDLANRSLKGREHTDVTIDTTCAIEDGDLGCEKPINAMDHRIWIVPEATAQKAGVTVLDQAIADGLPEEDKELANDK